MAKLTQIELNLGYCEEAQTYCSVAEERYKQGKADAERDFQNSDYWNDYLAKVIKDAKADAIDEFANWLVEQGILGNRCIADGEILENATDI